MISHRNLTYAMFRTVAELVRQQPILGVTLRLLVGIAFGYWIGCHYSFALLATPTLFLILRALRASRARALLLALPFGLGWLSSSYDATSRQREAEFFTRQTRLSFVCQVGPEVTVSPMRGRAARHMFTAHDFRAVDTDFTCKRLPVTINWYGAKPGSDATTPLAGECWQLTGKAKVSKNRNGLTRVRINCGERDARRLHAARKTSWQTRIATTRKEAMRRLRLGIEEWGAVPSLIQAMLLGARNEMPRAMRRIFADSGTIHVFAISGLHIALVAGLLIMVVRALGIQRIYWGVVVVPLLVYYTVATGSRPSAVRACMMATLYLCAPLLRRKPSGAAALLGTALIVHTVQPWLFYDAGNLLSFVVMGGLVVFCKPFCQALRQLTGLRRIQERRQLLLAAGAHGGARLWQLCATILGMATDTFAVSLAAWLSSVPLTAYYFGRFTPGGLLANLIVTPCAFMIVMSGCLGLLSSLFSFWVAACYNRAAAFFTVIMMRTAQITATMPGGNFRIRKWSPGMVAAWFMGLMVLGIWLYSAREYDGLAWLHEGEEG